VITAAVLLAAAAVGTATTTGRYAAHKKPLKKNL
jgi:hypothetical protein